MTVDKKDLVHLYTMLVMFSWNASMWAVTKMCMLFDLKWNVLPIRWKLDIYSFIHSVYFLQDSQEKDWIILVIPLVHEWNIVVLPEFNELKLVFHEAPAEWNTSFNELNEGNKAIFHEWTKGITSEHHSFLLSPNFKTKKLYFASKLKQIGKDLA